MQGERGRLGYGERMGIYRIHNLNSNEKGNCSKEKLEMVFYMRNIISRQYTRTENKVWIGSFQQREGINVRKKKK